MLRNPPTKCMKKRSFMGDSDQNFDTWPSSRHCTEGCLQMCWVQMSLSIEVLLFLFEVKPLRYFQVPSGGVYFACLKFAWILRIYRFSRALFFMEPMRCGGIGAVSSTTQPSKFLVVKLWEFPQTKKSQIRGTFSGVILLATQKNALL